MSPTPLSSLPANPASALPALIEICKTLINGAVTAVTGQLEFIRMIDELRQKGSRVHATSLQHHAEEFAPDVIAAILAMLVRLEYLQQTILACFNARPDLDSPWRKVVRFWSYQCSAAVLILAAKETAIAHGIPADAPVNESDGYGIRYSGIEEAMAQSDISVNAVTYGMNAHFLRRFLSFGDLTDIDGPFTDGEPSIHLLGVGYPALPQYCQGTVFVRVGASLHRAVRTTGGQLSETRIHCRILTFPTLPSTPCRMRSLPGAFPAFRPPRSAMRAASPGVG